jgi:hypothetical protein
VQVRENAYDWYEIWIIPFIGKHLPYCTHACFDRIPIFNNHASTQKIVARQESTLYISWSSRAWINLNIGNFPVQDAPLPPRILSSFAFSLAAFSAAMVLAAIVLFMNKM